MKEETRLLPVWHGGQVVAHALVDAADYTRLARYRWLIRGARRAYPHRVVTLGKMVRTRVEVTLARAVAGAPPGVIIKHRNGNLLDCRRENLTVKGGGVRFCKDSARNPWLAYISVDHHHYHLGGWPSREAAEAAREAAASAALEIRGRRLNVEQIQRALDIATGREARRRGAVAVRVSASIAAHLPCYLTPDEREDACQSIALDILSGLITPDGLTPKLLRGYAARVVGMTRYRFKFISLSQRTEDGREFGDHLAA